MLNTTTYFQLDQFLIRKYEEEFSTKCKVLSTSVSDTSKVKTHDLTKLRFPRIATKKRELIKLAVIHWYFPADVRFLVRLWLEEHLFAEYQVELEILLSSKEEALGFLLTSEEWNDSDFWGNVFPVNQPLLPWFATKYVDFQRIPTSKVHKLNTCEYRDKGSKRPSHDVVKYDFRKLRTEEEIELEAMLLTIRSMELHQRINERLRAELIS